MSSGGCPWLDEVPGIMAERAQQGSSCVKIGRRRGFGRTNPNPGSDCPVADQAPHGLAERTQTGSGPLGHADFGKTNPTPVRAVRGVGLGAWGFGRTNPTSCGLRCGVSFARPRRAWELRRADNAQPSSYRRLRGGAETGRYRTAGKSVGSAPVCGAVIEAARNPSPIE